MKFVLFAVGYRIRYAAVFDEHLSIFAKGGRPQSKQILSKANNQDPLYVATIISINICDL